MAIQSLMQQPSPLLVNPTKANLHDPLLDIQRLLITCLYERFTSFVQKLHRNGNLTKGLQRQDSERVYEETLNQELFGEIDDLFYSTDIL